MAVKQYEIEGQLYNVSEAREDDFLNDFKDKEITLVNGEQEDNIDPPVKKTDGVAGADAPSGIAAPESMGLDSGLGSSDLQNQQIDPIVKPRKGIRKNQDGSESTHLMAAEQLEDGSWVGFPTLFQDEDGTWVDKSKGNWEDAYKEALQRGEVTNFGTDKNAAIAFGEGSWKSKKQNDLDFSRGYLDLSGPVEETPIPFKPEALTEEEKFLENKRREKLQPIQLPEVVIDPRVTNAYKFIERSIRLIDRNDIDWTQVQKNDPAYNEEYLIREERTGFLNLKKSVQDYSYDGLLKTMKSFHLNSKKVKGLDEYEFEQIFSEVIGDFADTKRNEDIISYNNTLTSIPGYEISDNDKYSIQLELQNQKENKLDIKFLELSKKATELQNKLKISQDPTFLVTGSKQLNNLNKELNRLRNIEIESDSFFDLLKKNPGTAGSDYLLLKYIQGTSVLGKGETEPMFDLDGNFIKWSSKDNDKYKNSQNFKKVITNVDIQNSMQDIQLEKENSQMSDKEFYQNLDKQNLVSLYNNDLLGEKLIQVTVPVNSYQKIFKNIEAKFIEPEGQKVIITDKNGKSKEFNVQDAGKTYDNLATYELKLKDLAKVKDKVFLNKRIFFDNFTARDWLMLTPLGYMIPMSSDEALYRESLEATRKDIIDKDTKKELDLYSLVDMYSNQRADILSRNKALRLISRFNVDPTTLQTKGSSVAIDMSRALNNAFQKNNIEVIPNTITQSESKIAVSDFITNNKEALKGYNIDPKVAELTKPSTLYNAGKQIVDFQDELSHFAYLAKQIATGRKIIGVDKFINSFKFKPVNISIGNKTVSLTQNTIKKTSMFAIAAGIEEYKMHKAFNQYYHQGGGVAFVSVGALASKFPPLTSFNIFNKLLSTPGSAGVFATSSQVATFFEGGLEDFKGGKTFKRHIEDNYPDYDATQQRLIGDLIFGSFLKIQSSSTKAISNLAQGKRNFEWMSTAKLNNLNIASKKNLSAATNLYNSQLQRAKQEGKSEQDFNKSNLGQKLLDNINKHSIIFTGTTSVLSKMTGETDLKSGDLDRVEKWYKRNHKRNLENWSKVSGAGADIIYVKDGNRTQFKTEGVAEFDGNNKIYVDLKRVSEQGLFADSGLVGHEINHKLTVEAFKNNPQAKKQVFDALKTEFPEVLRKIKEAYREEISKNPSILEDEYISYFVQILGDKSNYNAFTAKQQGKNGANTWSSIVDFTNKKFRELTGWTPFENGSEVTKNQIIRYYADLALNLRENRITDKEISTLKQIGKSGFNENININEVVLEGDGKEFASKDIENLAKTSNKIQNIYEGREPQKPNEGIEQYTDRLLKYADKIDRINFLDSKGNERTPQETAERRNLKTEKYNEIIPFYKNFVDVLANKYYKSVQEQAYTREDFKSDLNLQILELMNTYKPSSGTELNYYIYNNLPKRIGGILEGKVSRDFTQELSDASGQIIDAEITENIDANTKLQEQSLTEKQAIDPTKIFTDNIIETASEKVNVEDIPLSDLNYSSLSKKFNGEVAETIFDVPANKITNPAANLTYAKRITNGIPEPSEAGKIQDFIRKNINNIIKLLPETNVASEQAIINKKGEIIDVSRDKYGVSIGTKNAILKLFYTKTGKRSKGLKSQVAIYEKNSDLYNLTPEKTQQILNQFGITPKGELNIYNREIGQRLKGISSLYSSLVVNKIARNKIELANNPTNPEIKQLLANIKAGASDAMAAKEGVIFASSTLNKAFKKFNITESEKFELYSIEDVNKLKTTNPDLYEKYDNVLIETSKKSSDAAERKLIKRNNEAALLNNKLINLTKFVTGDNSTQVDHLLKIVKDKNNVLDIGLETKMQKPRMGQADFVPVFDTKGKIIDLKVFEGNKNENIIDLEATPELKQKLLDALNAYAGGVKEVSSGKESFNKHRAEISEKTKKALGKKGKNIQKNLGIKVDAEIESIISHYLNKGGNFIEFIKEDGSADVYSIGPDIYKSGATPLNGTGTFEFRFKFSKNAKGKIPIRIIGEYRLTQEQITEKTKLNIKTSKEFSNFIDKISENAFASKDLSPSDIMKQIEVADSNNMRDVVAARLFSEQFKNKPRFMQGFSSLNEKQKQVVLKEMAKADLTTASFNNKLLPKSERLTGEFTNDQVLKRIQELDIANDREMASGMASKDLKRKGISVFDFDDTLARTNSRIGVTMPDGAKKKINATEFALESAKLESQGAKFDFSEFNKVIDGKKGPLADLALKRQGKFGNEDIFILTARPQESAPAIKAFMKELGLDIPLKNITGLADGTAKAKADWIEGKTKEGYNDFYFADDALKNVQAVKDVLKNKDINSKIEQALVMASKKLDVDFNKIIERSTKGKISAGRVLSQTEAIMEGRSKGRFDIFIRPQAEDFVGLLYKMLGKGEQGNADMAFFKKTLLDPFAKGIANISADRISLLNDYKFLVRNLRVPGERGVKGLLKTPPLKRKVGETGFTTEQAVRAYVWTKQGMEIPGLSESQLKKLLLHVKENKELITFGNQLININKGDGYIKPSNNWLSGSIGTDILQGLNTTKRSKYLEVWQKNADVIFSPENLNKLQAAYGKPYVDAMKNMLTRMKTGRNRVSSGDTITTKFTDFIAQATGSIMFLNSRSAVLQTISSLNFINFGDNNIFAAGKAFANQKQYWKDFSKLYNSDFLKDRRSGLRINVIEADISAAAKRGGISGVTSRLLELGFTPTQIADSFAISAGGSTFYRNRIKTYEKETDVDGNKIYTKEQAEQKAFQDFRETAEESQQSSRPDKISQEQAGGLGRHVLAFANTPAQYARIIKKSALDLKNGRGDAKTNISKIVYYTFAQNIIFNTLQQAIFATAFDDDLKVTEEKSINLANGMTNSVLRGMGVYPAVGAAVKDAAIKIYTEKQKKKPQFEKAAIQLLNIAPPLGSKYRKIAGGLKTYDFTTVDAAIEKGISLDNPAIRGGARITEGLTNLPLDRLLIKLDNIQGALDQDNEYWQRIGMGLGWQDWQLGIKDEKQKKKATGGFRTRKFKTQPLK